MSRGLMIDELSTPTGSPAEDSAAILRGLLARFPAINRTTREAVIIDCVRTPVGKAPRGAFA